VAPIPPTQLPDDPNSWRTFWLSGGEKWERRGSKVFSQNWGKGPFGESLFCLKFWFNFPLVLVCFQGVKIGGVRAFEGVGSRTGEPGLDVEQGPTIWGG